MISKRRREKNYHVTHNVYKKKFLPAKGKAHSHACQIIILYIIRGLYVCSPDRGGIYCAMIAIVGVI